MSQFERDTSWGNAASRFASDIFFWNQHIRFLVSQKKNFFCRLNSRSIGGRMCPHLAPERDIFMKSYLSLFTLLHIETRNRIVTTLFNSGINEFHMSELQLLDPINRSFEKDQ
jgi:hypothetical protein